MSPPVPATATSRRVEAGARAVLARNGKIMEWNTELALFCARPAEQALGRHFTELLVVLEPATLPDDLHALKTEGWRGVVALVPAERTRLPTPGLAELASSRDGETLELTFARLPQLNTNVKRNAPNTPPDNDTQHNDTQRLQAILGHMPGFCYTVNADLVFTSSAGRGLALAEPAAKSIGWHEPARHVGHPRRGL